MTAAERLPEILDCFDKDPAEALRQLDVLFEAARIDTDALSLAIRSRRADFLVAYLLRTGSFFRTILDPVALSIDDTTAALKLAMTIDAGCDIAALGGLIRSRGPAEQLTRLIDLSSRVRLSGRLRPVLEPLLSHENPFLSSKVELLLKRLDTAERSLRQRLGDPDPRTQADAIEFLWGEDTPESREVFRRAVKSPNDRVLGNGLLGLYMLGDPLAIRTTFDIAENQSPLVRPTAIWFMGQTGDPRFLPWLVESMGTNDNRLRSRIFQAIRQIRERKALAVACGRLRLHVVAASLNGKRERTIRFTVAGDGRAVIRRLPATQVLISEDSKFIQDFSLQPVAGLRPADIYLLCSGGATLPDSLESLLGPDDRLQAKSMSGAGAESELERFSAGTQTDAILWINGGDPPEVPNAPALIESLRASGKRVHALWPASASVRQSLPLDALARGTGGLALRVTGSATAALEQAISLTMHSYEVRYEGPVVEEPSLPLQVQVVSHHGAGDATSMFVRRRDAATNVV